MAKNQFTPLRPGTLCPLNRTEWETMKKKRNCPDPEFYHCIPDQHNVPGEICIRANWASKNYCPIFNTVANDIDLIPCDLQYGACSNIDYRSNMVYQYPGCLNNTFIIGGTTTETPRSPPVQLHIIIPAIVVPLLLIIIGVAIIYYYRRRGAKSDANHIESQPLLHRNEVPLSFRKTRDYLENKVFYQTKSYEQAIGILDTFGHITLIGPPGSGKTLMAVQLARRQCGEEEKSQLFFCKTLQEIVKLPDLKNGCMYIIMDDWLDHYMYYPSKEDEDIQMFDKILEDFVKTERVQIIFTVQEDRWVACKDHLSDSALFSHESCFTINDKSFSKEELQGMVKNHFMFHKIKENSKSMTMSSEEKTLAEDEMVVSKNTKGDIAKLLKSEEEFSLPVIIDLICTNRRLLRSRNLIFKDGFKKILQKFLDNWSTDSGNDEKDSFCILVFAALRGGKVSFRDFKSNVFGHIYERICKGYNSKSVEDIESIERLLRQNQRLKGCLYPENDTFVFHHDSLLCFVLQSVIKTRNASFFIQNADIDLLLKRCWIKEIMREYEAASKDIVLNDPVGSVPLSIDVLKELATRVEVERRRGHQIPDWPKHVFMKHATFYKMWEQACTELNVADPEIEMEKLTESDKSQVKPDESTNNSKKEEANQDPKKDADSNVTENDPSLVEPEENSGQSKHKAKKNKDKASYEKADSKLEKHDPEKEARPSSIAPSQQNVIFSDLNEGKLTGNDPNPHGHAKNNCESKHKTKKNEGKLSFIKTKGKSKTQESEKESGAATQEKKLFSNLTEGETVLY